MKKISLALSFLFIGMGLSAQNADVEATVRALEQKETKAVVAHDTVTLLQLWAPDFTVNAPTNMIAKGGNNTLDRPVMRLQYVSLNRNTEHVMQKGDMVICMGNEVVVEKGKDGNPDRTIKRRYTNIWQKQGNSWMLIARHANVICAAP